ncbi:MAG TPA: GNAT family N-acetyltransferase [Bacteroidota bacterium]|nr:GNAT family N-acetyltransferase [Bacteroidota bacterium]
MSAIRPLQREDREPLHRLLAATGFFTPKEITIALELIDVVLTKADQKDYIIFVHDDGRRVLGYYCIGPTPGTDGTFDLYWIAVAPAAQGKGVGTMLDAHAHEFIRSRGGRLVIAETSSQPRYAPTRKFYLARGYTEVSCIRDYYRVGDDLVVYGKYLT